jgi:multidrug efflux system outer membrane protein
MFSAIGCSAGADYRAPSHQFIGKHGQSWLALQNAALPVIPQQRIMQPGLPWWQQTDDPLLPQLINAALLRNNELKQVYARVDEARANARSALSTMLPRVDGTIQGDRGTVNSLIEDRPVNSHQGGASAQWNLDLAGAAKRRYAAAWAAAQAAEAEAVRVRQALVAEVARAYIDVRRGQKQYALTSENLFLQQGLLTAVTYQRQAGAVSDFEVARAAAQTHSTMALLPSLEQENSENTNRLALLLAMPPHDVRPILQIAGMIPSLPVGQVMTTPIKVIRAHPDIQNAERRLAEAIELRGAAVAAFYPDISLSGFIGFQRNSFGNTQPWQVALSGLMPLLNFGGIQSQLDAADARGRQAFYHYRQTVSRVLADAENSLSGYLTENARLESLRTAARHHKKASEVVQAQYKAGVATQLDWLITAQNKLEAENAATASEAQTAKNLVALYQAMGQDSF